MQNSRGMSGREAIRPIVTELLIGINFFVFVFVLAYAKRLTGSTPGSFANQLEFIASNYGLRPDQINPLTLFTAMFLHLDPWHLGLNLVFLYFFGRMVEQALGHWKFAVFYLGCGLAAELLQIGMIRLFLPDQVNWPVPVLGASGAISGTLGYCAIRFSAVRLSLGALGSVRASLVLSAWLTVQLVAGVYSLYKPSGGGVAYWSHIGGFLVGMGIARFLRHLERGGRSMTVSGPDASSPGPLGSDSPRFHCQIAEVAVKLGENERAARHYLKALELALQKGTKAQVVEVYETATLAVGELPLDAPTRYKIGLYLEESGKYELAAAALESVLATNPDSQEAEMSALKAAQIHLGRLGSPGRAADVLKVFLARYPGSAWRLYAEQILDQARAAEQQPAQEAS